LLSLPLIQECSEYVYVEGASGRIEHPKSRTGFDASEQGENHGDRAVAAAICLRTLGSSSRVKPAEISPWKQLDKAPVDSLGYRIRQAEREVAEPLSCEW